MIKAFSKKLLLWLFPIFTMVGINYLIDSANLFNQEIIEEASQFVSQGKSVAGLTNYDERFFQKRVIDLNAIPNVVVIGSSRVMQIGNDNWGSSFYNNGVSSATIMDYYAIIQHYINKGSILDTILIGFNMDLILEDPNGINWISVSKDYFKLCGTLNLEPIATKKFKFYKNKILELISPKYFYENLVNKNFVAPLNESNNKEKIELLDGSLIYNELYRIRDEDKVAKNIDLQVAQAKPFERKYNKQYLEHFDKLIQFLIENKKTIYFIKTPCFPTLYDKFRSNPDFVTAEKSLALLADKYQIPSIGTYYKNDLNYASFYDARHPTESL